MKNLVKKVAVGFSTGALVAQSLVFPALAEITVTISGNGVDSTNTGNVSMTNTTTVTQDNHADIENNINATASTGGNSASENTGAGDVTIDTGNATSDVTVTNAVNSNEADVDCSGCPQDLTVEISDNGDSSKNTADVDLTNTTWVDQDNKADVDNHVKAVADSGNNVADENTGDGDVEIDTGNATATAWVTNWANANVATVGGDGEGALELTISGNGVESDNLIEADLINTTTVWQDNWADISNDVLVDASTGGNSASENTGSGSVTVDTGDADASATVDNAVNFNWAEVLDCCLLSGTVKVADNGDSSTNTVDLDLTSTLFADQVNAYDCEGDHWLELWWDGHGHDCNNVHADANSGDNVADENTSGDGDPEIDTGDATSEVDVTNEANSNVFTTGDVLPDPSDWEWDGSMSWWLWFFGIDFDESMA